MPITTIAEASQRGITRENTRTIGASATANSTATSSGARMPAGKPARGQRQDDRDHLCRGNRSRHFGDDHRLLAALASLSHIEVGTTIRATAPSAKASAGRLWVC